MAVRGVGFVVVRFVEPQHVWDLGTGEPLWGNYPPGEQTIAEYKASIADATPPA